MEQEEWKDIDGYVGVYQVSNRGRVKRLKSKDRNGRVWPECILKQFKVRGYLSCGLSWAHKSKKFRVNRLVATAFVPNPDNKPCVEHIDCNKLNNRADNLRWCSYKENNNNPITKKRQTKYFYKGLSVKEWANIMGMSYYTLIHRVNNNKMSMLEAINFGRKRVFNGRKRQ